MSDNHLPIEGAGREELKTLYSWTLEDAMQAQEEWAKGEHSPEARGPIFRWSDAQWLKKAGEYFLETGDKAAILEALSICSLSDLPIPKWCAKAYLKAYRSVRQYRAKSWDDAFGRPHPKNTKIGAKRDEREKEFILYDRVEEMKKKNPKTDKKTILERTGKELCIGEKLAEKYYYQVRARIKKILG